MKVSYFPGCTLKTKAKELDKNKSLRETCLTSGCNISTDTLIKEGLLNEKDVDKQEVIHITKENNEKKCIVKDD